jgi:hypothetical protein
MSNVEEILRESIVDQCGPGGLLRFNALYRGGFETADGRPDLTGISAAIGGAFPADQATAIVAVVTKRLEPDGQPVDRPAVAGAETVVSEGQGSPLALAKFFAADPNHVRDIVNEARRVRAAMGKSMPPRWVATPDRMVMNTAAEPEKTPEADWPVPEKAPASPAMPAENRLRPARVIAEPLSAVDEEIRRFAYGRTACTSIDIMEFISHLKDKGYSLQEYIVLEKIYVTIEERKKEARFAIEKEIEGLIAARKAPEEPEIQGLLRRLGEAGLVFEEGDVRRMIRRAVLRRA